MDTRKALSASNTMATLIEVAEQIDQLVEISFNDCERQIEEAIVIGEQSQRLHDQHFAYRQGLRAAYAVVMRRYRQRTAELESVDYHDSPLGDHLRFVPNRESKED